MDWLKEILGDSYTDDIKKKAAEEIGKQFVSRADLRLKTKRFTYAIIGRIIIDI